MSLLSKPYTFSAGSTIIAAEHNSNFDTLYNDWNGNLTNANVASGAAISYSKLSLTGSIVNADISTSAAISGSKISQISAANSLSGTAFMNLGGIPSGAGFIPTVNFATGGSSDNFYRGDGTFAITKRTKTGSISLDLTTSGTTAVSGVGFRPLLVYFTGMKNGSKESSIGFDTGPSNAFTQFTSGTSIFSNTSGESVYCYENASNQNYGHVGSFTGDGFNFNNFKVGTPTGTYTIYYLAER